MRGPDIVKGSAATFMNLSEDEWLIALTVKNYIERTGGRAFKPGIKTRPGMGRQLIKQNAKRVNRIDSSQSGIPLRRKGRICLRCKIRGAELAKEFVGRTVCEAKITVDEFLVEDGGAKKTPHLLLFDGFARRRQNVAAPGKDGAGNLPVKRRKKAERPFVKGEDGVAAPQLNAIGGRDAISIGGVDAERLDGIVEFMRGSFRGGKDCRRQETR